MKVNFKNNQNQQPSFKSLYNNKTFKKGLEFASEHGALFGASTSLVLSTLIRPISILAAPKTDKDNKKYACAKSISSSLIGFILLSIPSLSIAKGIRKIDKTPIKYLKPSTIKNLQDNKALLNDSKAYMLATQLFKLGLGIIMAAPKAIIACILIPPVMCKLFAYSKQSNQVQEEPAFKKQISFKRKPIIDSLAIGMGKLIDTSLIQKICKKFKDTNFELHIISLTDVLSTLIFMQQTKKNRKIEDKFKKTLIYNAAISTGLTITGAYTLNKALEKHTNKFIEKFSQINKSSPKLSSYIEGIKIGKSVLLLGVMYYIIVPFISIFLADKFEAKSRK